jgi:hypothetical protein
MFGDKRIRLFGGCALAGMCVLFGVLPAAQAFEVKETSGGQPIHWEDSAIVFETDPSVEFVAPGASASIADGVAPWSSMEGAPGISMQPATGFSQPEYDNRNVIYFYPHGYELAGAALAVTIVTFDDTTGSILDTDIVLNGRYSFGVLPTGALPDAFAHPVSNDGASSTPFSGLPGAAFGRFDLLHVVAHETGHALGMRDEMVDPSTVMYLYTLPGDASRRTPTPDDLDGIKEIYAGASSSAQGCSSSTVSPRRARMSPFALGGALLLAAIVWAFAGRRRIRARGPLALAGALAVIGIGPAQAHVSKSARSSLRGDATARIVSARRIETEGPWRTEVTLSPTECRTEACPTSVTVTHWGGRRGHLVQQVGEFVPPRVGDDVEIVADESAESGSGFRILQ